MNHIWRNNDFLKFHREALGSTDVDGQVDDPGDGLRYLDFAWLYMPPKLQRDWLNNPSSTELFTDVVDRAVGFEYNRNHGLPKNDHPAVRPHNQKRIDPLLHLRGTFHVIIVYSRPGYGRC